jgi:hypothetical protein
MPKWIAGTPLRPDQTAHALLWHERLENLGYGKLVLELEDGWFDALWGDKKSSRRLRSFGQLNPEDHGSPHFLATRGGLPMHTDPAYARYALQIQLVNQGWVVHGLEDKIEDMPLFTPGLVNILDTWSPHIVPRDPRLPQVGNSKLLAGMDFREMPDVERELPKLIEHLRKGIRF